MRERLFVHHRKLIFLEHFHALVVGTCDPGVDWAKVHLVSGYYWNFHNFRNLGKSLAVDD